MKKSTSVFLSVVFLMSILLGSSKRSTCQTLYEGNWHGMFMNDFEVNINFKNTENNSFEGKIKMFAGENLVQDDFISNISIEKTKCNFLIPAKNTRFKGRFNDAFTELSGIFIFPDSSKHELRVERNNEPREKIDSFEDFRAMKNKEFSKTELSKDLHFLYTNLCEVHPAAFNYISKDSVNLLFQTLDKELNSGLNLEEFFHKASRLTDAVKCSHTGVRLPVKYQKLVNKYGNLFPLEIYFSDNKAYYLSEACENKDKIKKGLEIASINDRSIQKIISQLFYFIPSEGGNESTKYKEINKNFRNLYYLIDNSDNFKIGFIKAGVESTNVVKPCDLDNIDLVNAVNMNDKSAKFNFIEEKSLGIITIPTFAIRDMNYYFFQLDSIFNLLNTKGAKNVVLDLRNNSGGHPIFAAQLFSYLTNKEFKYFKENKDVVEFEPLYKLMQANKNNFKGDIYVFVNGGCLSTTGHLISLLKYHTNAIFIGEDPGSTYKCNDFSMQLILPNTKIELNVPRTTFETNVTGFSLKEPFNVDYQASISVDEIITGKDKYFSTLNNLLENKKQEK